MQSCLAEDYDLVQNLGNITLVRTMRHVQRVSDDKSREMFLTALSRSQLLAFSNAPILATSVDTNRSGLSTYGLGSQFSLAMLTDANGNSVLPLFTSKEAYTQQSFMQLEHCIAMRFPQMLDIAVAAGAIGVVVDFSLEHSVELPYESMLALLDVFREQGLVDDESCVSKEGEAVALGL